MGISRNNHVARIEDEKRLAAACKTARENAHFVVATMHAGDRVRIYGCLTGWFWCDISWRGHRGWAAGRYLQVFYRSHRAPIISYGRYIGVPFIGFNITIYWNSHYKKRSFYHELPKFDRNGPPHPPKEPPHRNPPRQTQNYQGKPPRFQNAPPMIQNPPSLPGNRFGQRDRLNRPPCGPGFHVERGVCVR
jgi:hypothetical protein